MRLLLTLRRWLRMDLGDVVPNSEYFAGTKLRGKPQKSHNFEQVLTIRRNMSKQGDSLLYDGYLGREKIY